MTFTKKISSGSGVPSNNQDKNNFPMGQQYKYGETLCVISECFRSDNTEMRRVSVSGDNDELIELRLLQRDLREGAITFPEAIAPPTPPAAETES